mmetsp:Transcript_21794/g.24324  ORF Transcript_21794/g.24324 Transcript_21794/m.24324 type:complete len:427 (-) Transcript_21794:55-1335(-)
MKASLVILLFSLVLVSSFTGAKRRTSKRQEEPAVGVGDDVRPAPASIGADIPLSYFGPPPSAIQPELIGPFQLLKSGVVNEETGTIQLPLYLGYVGSGYEREKQWYILTDSTDGGNAEALGLNHSPKLRYANGPGVRNARLIRNVLYFQRGKVDFSPERRVVPDSGENAFPPIEAQAGSVGDKYYTPLVLIENAGMETYNAPVVAGDVDAAVLRQYCDGIPAEKLQEARRYVHDDVVAICPDDDNPLFGLVTLRLVPGFSFARPVLYLSTDVSDMAIAAVETATFSPALSTIVVGGDDGAFSAVERLFAVRNGYTGQDVNTANLPDGPGEVVHPARQGLNSALLDGFSPLNVLGGIPTIATDYSPLWDVNLGEWTPYAVANGYRVRWLEEFQILGFVQSGFVTGPDGSDFGSTGVIVNCPIVHRFL